MISGSDTANALRASRESLRSAYASDNPGESELGKEDFLTLMMAQATNQDPLNPMDSNAMMQQVTAMGSIEQLMNVNKGLDQLNTVSADLAQANAYSFLDKDVTVKGGMATVSEGTVPAIQYDLPNEAQSVTVAITRSDGSAVRNMELGGQAQGTQAVPWDARDADGKLVPNGVFQYAVTAKDAGGNEIPVNLYVTGKVSAVRFDKGRHFVQVNNEMVDVRDIIGVSQKSQNMFGTRTPGALRGELPLRPLAEKAILPVPRDED